MSSLIILIIYLDSLQTSFIKKSYTLKKTQIRIDGSAPEKSNYSVIITLRLIAKELYRKGVAFASAQFYDYFDHFSMRLITLTNAKTCFSGK